MYRCQECDYQSSVKLGKCPRCASFGTLVQQSNNSDTHAKAHRVRQGSSLRMQVGKKIKQGEKSVRNMPHAELQRSFGEGWRVGGIYLLAGEPGMGKSTLVLQMVHMVVAANTMRVAYCTGEETQQQVMQRYARLVEGKTHAHVDVFHTTHFEDIIATLDDGVYDMIVIDSIQTIYSPHIDSAAGSAQQVRYCSEKLSEFCKQKEITACVVGHVTKGGEIAGPKYLEHIVDVVLYLEGDRYGPMRFLRTKKNRFGSTDSSAIFDMTEQGLQPVYNLSERLMSQAHVHVPGTVVSVSLDNGRPVLVTVQALLTKNHSTYATRNCVGVRKQRVEMILAILQKYLGYKLFSYDLYINVPGNFQLADSGLDLAIAGAIMSQYHDTARPAEHLLLGQLELSGHISASRLHGKRRKEAPVDWNILDHTTVQHIKDIESYIL